jgi:beta-lactamase superfamily II metal-dependent hydrolase
MAHLGASAIVESARLVDIVPWLTFRVPAPSAITIGGYYFGLALQVFTHGARPRFAGLVCLLAGGVVMTTGVRFAHDVPGLRLTMLDVGQGDAMALQVAGQHTVMIDSGGSPFGGGSFDIGTRVVGRAE